MEWNSVGTIVVSAGGSEGQTAVTPIAKQSLQKVSDRSR